jgi:hypothetical protein
MIQLMTYFSLLKILRLMGEILMNDYTGMNAEKSDMLSKFSRLDCQKS